MNALRTDPMFADIQLDAEQQDALLVHLAEDVRRGVAAVEDVSIPGSFGLCLKTGLPTFVPDPQAVAAGVTPPLDAMLELSYHHQGNTSWFDSQLMSSGPDGVWRLRSPSVVTSATRRLVPRTRCGPREPLQLPLEGIECGGFEGSLQAGDISTGGLGILYDQRRIPITTGQRLEGWLPLPGQDALRVILGVVTVAIVYPGSSLRRASTRFVSMPLEERLQLACELAALSRPHGYLAAK
jgi:hypothetical protein